MWNLIKNYSKLVALIMAIFMMAGCESAKVVDLNISAASSLQEAMEELVAVFTDEFPGVKVNLNFAGSNVLMRQIAEGFPVDVFLAAHKDPILELEEMGLVEEKQLFAQNELVLVTSREEIETFYAIGEEGVRVVLASETVPVGIYAREVLEQVDKDHPGFKEAALANLMTEAGNVRQVLLKVSLGEGDVGFVYRTDVNAVLANEVYLIEIPEAYQVISELFMARIRSSDMKDESRLFYDFVLSERGQSILISHGFQ